MGLLLAIPLLIGMVFLVDNLTDDSHPAGRDTNCIDEGIVPCDNIANVGGGGGGNAGDGGGNVGGGVGGGDNAGDDGGDNDDGGDDDGGGSGDDGTDPTGEDVAAAEGGNQNGDDGNEVTANDPDSTEEGGDGNTGGGGGGNSGSRKDPPNRDKTPAGDRHGGNGSRAQNPDGDDESQNVETNGDNAQQTDEAEAEGDQELRPAQYGEGGQKEYDLTLLPDLFITKENPNELRTVTVDKSIERNSIEGTAVKFGKEAKARLEVPQGIEISSKGKAIDASEAEQVEIVNSGTIDAEFEAIHMPAGEKDVALENHGIISSQGKSEYAVNAEGSFGAEIDNFGNAEISGETGAVHGGFNAQIENYGSIVSVLDHTISLFSGEIRNFDTISSTSGFAIIFESFDSSSGPQTGEEQPRQVTNEVGSTISGGIKFSQSEGLRSGVTNHGRIFRGQSDYAIEFGVGSSNLLTIKERSLISGKVKFENNFNNVLLVDSNYSGQLVTNYAGFDGFIEAISVATNPDSDGFFTYSFVPQQLAKAQQPVEDDTDQAKKSLGSQGTASFVGMMLNSPAAQGHEGRAGLGFSSQADPYHTASTDPQFWMSALSAGGTVNAHADQATGLSFHENTGYMAGVGQHVAKGLKLGAFAGFSSQEESSEGETSHYKTENNFAGLRAEIRHQGWFADLSLTSGTIDFDNSREIPDITDTDIAVSSYRGLYAMPSVTIGHTLRFGGLVFEPSASFDYTHMQFDGFTETGTENALHGEARELGIWQTRGQLALATGNKAEGFLTARAGVELKGYTGEKFEGHINGLILQNVPDLPADSLTTYFGGTYVRDITDAWSLYGDMEWQQGAGEEEDNFEAKARLKMDF